jgi:hypothetical protein
MISDGLLERLEPTTREHVDTNAAQSVTWAALAVSR